MAANEAFARQYVEGSAPAEQVSNPNKTRELALPKRQEKVQAEDVPWTGSEKFLAGILVVMFFAFSILSVSHANQMNNLNREVQDVNAAAQETQLKNENLEQNVQELSKYERVNEVAQDHDLKRVEENVRNITK